MDFPGHGSMMLRTRKRPWQAPAPSKSPAFNGVGNWHDVIGAHVPAVGSSIRRRMLRASGTGAPGARRRPARPARKDQTCSPLCFPAVNRAARRKPMGPDPSSPLASQAPAAVTQVFRAAGLSATHCERKFDFRPISGECDRCPSASVLVVKNSITNTYKLFAKLAQS